MEEDSRHAYFMKQALLMVIPAWDLYMILSKSRELTLFREKKLLRQAKLQSGVS